MHFSAPFFNYLATLRLKPMNGSVFFDFCV